VAGFLLFFLSTTFEVDLGDTWGQIKRSNPWYYLFAFLAHYASFPVRGLRWRIIISNAKLDAKAGSRLRSTVECTYSIFIGWFVSTISWFRLGDPYRAFILSKALGGSFSGIFGTIIADRIIDVVSIFLLLLLSGSILVFQRGLHPSPALLIIAFILVVTTGIFLVLMKYLGIRLSRMMPTRLAKVYTSLYQGTMGSFRKLHIIGLLSLIIWGAEFGRLVLILHGLGLSLPASLILFLVMSGALLSTVPITPGGIGIVEVGITGFLTMELSRDIAVSVVLLDRSISYLSIVIIGGILFLFANIMKSFKIASRQKSRTERFR